MSIGVNKAGVDWLLIKRWIAEQIERDQGALEHPDTSEKLTHYLRGRIGILRALISEVEAPEAPEAEDTREYV